MIFDEKSGKFIEGADEKEEEEKLLYVPFKPVLVNRILAVCAADGIVVDAKKRGAALDAVKAVTLGSIQKWLTGREKAIADAAK